MKISVIIPAYNEEDVIARTLDKVGSLTDDNIIQEIIVVDGGSSDATVSLASQTEAMVVESPDKGRAAQMNYGASIATGDILYFLHADSHPPEGFGKKIISSVDNGRKAGCFRLAFDCDHPLLKFYAWFTRFDIDAFRFGDQSLFISAKVFDSIGGFRADHIVMEDNEIIKRIKNATSFTLIPDYVITSSRRYVGNGALRLQLTFILIFTLYKVGVSQEKLYSIYKRLIH